MTWEQRSAYFKQIDLAARACGAKSAAEREALRQQIHLDAFGAPKSAKEINHLKDFDQFKAACLARLQPTNLAAQMRQAEMPTTRLVYSIRQLAPEAYIIAEAARKFRTEDFTTLNESDLTMLRNHISKRAAGIRWPAQASGHRDVQEMPMAGGDPF